LHLIQAYLECIGVDWSKNGYKLGLIGVVVGAIRDIFSIRFKKIKLI